MKTFKWILTSMLITGLMVAGFAFDVPGARNVFSALIWLHLVLAVFIQAAAKPVQEVEQIVPENVRWIVFFLHFLFLAWFGEFLLGAVYFTGFVLIAAARNKQSSVKTEVA